MKVIIKWTNPLLRIFFYALFLGLLLFLQVDNLTFIYAGF